MSKRKEDSSFACFLPMVALLFTAASTVITVLTGQWLQWPALGVAYWGVAQAIAAIEDRLK